MKNLNLLNFKWLWTDSHEKQKPQRFGRYAAMLIMLLTLGVGQMWCKDIYVNYDACTYYLDGDCGKIHAWGGTGADQDVTISWVTGNIGKATIDDDHNNIIFYRYYDSKWNIQSADISISDNKNYYFIGVDNNKTIVNATAYVTIDSYVYFDRSNVAWNNTIQFWLGRNGHTECYDISTSNYVPNTELKYYRVQNWYNYDRYRFVNTTSYSGGDWTMDDGAHNPTNYTGTTKNDWLAENTYNLFTFNGTNGGALTKTEYNDWNSLNYTQTVQAFVKNGDNAYALDYSKANITCTSYKMNSATGSTSSTNPTVSSGSVKQETFLAAHTAATTLVVGAVTSGYEFIGWYDDSGNQLTTNTTYSHKPQGATIRRAYFAQKHNVTFNTGINGTVSPTGVQSVGQKGVTITASSPAAGYYFAGWTCTGGASVASSTSATTTVTATGTGTVTANFAKRFVLRGSRSTGDDSNTEGMPGWSTTDADMTISAGVSTKEVTLYPNREYKFMIYDKQHGRNCGYTSQDQTLPANTQTGSMDGTYHILMNTAGYGTYRFSVAVSAADGSGNTWPKVTITNPSSWMITMGQKTVTDGCWTPVDEEGGTISAKTTEAGTDFDISDGKYVRNGGTVTFTATPASGFMFDGWYDNSSCEGDPISTAREYAMENITSAKTVYAKFVEVTFSVNVFLGNDGNDGTVDWQTVKVGVKSHPSITANTITDQVFDRWEVIGSATFGDAYSKTTTVSGVTDAQTTVVATHKDPPTLYYVIERPTSWNPSTMYVYFYSNDYWNIDSGSGSGYGCMKVAQMTAVEGKNNKWWKYTFNPETDPQLSGNSIASVSFMEYQQLSKNNFDGNNTGTHRDYHSCMNMFIVTTTGGTNHLNGNTCWYYNDGYWYNYEDDKSGYYLHNLPGDEVEFIADANGIYSASVNLEATHDYYFYIGGCDGKNWANDEHYTGANHEHTLGIFNTIEGDANKVHFTTSAGGIYKFKLTPIYNTADNSAHMKLNIIYPVQANDYRARYNNAASSPTVSRPSNTISSDRDHGAISLWLNEGTNYITFEKATVNGSTGALTWTSVGTQQTVTDVPENGVYTMTLTRSGETYTVSSIFPYTGDFYIRTDCAFGGWKDYVINGMTNNTLTFDKDDASTFDYYYCKWIKDAGTNVRFAVANDLNAAISDTLIHDAALGDGDEETLPEAANVRFAWNSHTNTLSRAYLSGSTNPNDRFLIMHGNVVDEDHKLLTSGGATIDYSATYSNLAVDEAYFNDRNNWVYQVDLKAKSGAEIYLTAYYNGANRDLYASSASPKAILTSSNTDNSYPITATYDFKTNNMLIAWHPGNDPQIAENLSNLPSVMVMREHQGDAEQITFNGGSIAGTRVYGVMNFNKWTLNNQDKDSHASYTGDDIKSETERSLFWISFPFDVRLKDVFGFGEYGRHWIIEYYDGAGRAKNGWWIDSDTNWKFVLTDSLEHGGEDKQGYILKANVGYVLALDLVELTHVSSIWNNDVEDVYLYFPSISDKVTINNSLPESVVVPKHECTIERDDRKSKDCNWNVIGVPIYANEGTGLSQEGVKFFYAWDPKSNELDAKGATSTGVMHSMHAYMVQFAGTINWRTHTMTPASVAARRSENAPKDAYMFRLDLMQGGKSVDKTFVELSEDATISFDVNKDMTKMLKQTQSNIYTLVAGNEGNIQVAGNCLPLNTQQTTIVPVGVKILADGEFSFSMPEGTEGVGIVLIDNIAGTRTNLALTDYTVTLAAGTYDERFALEISPIAQTPTDIENVQSDNVQSTKVRKVMVDGVLYIVKDGKVFDARGNRLQ